MGPVKSAACWSRTSNPGRWSTCASVGRRQLVSSLHRLWDRFQPQMNDYVTRALDPGSAPAFGVPGDPGAAAVAEGRRP
jgi:hypothetical protein